MTEQLKPKEIIAEIGKMIALTELLPGRKPTHEDTCADIADYLAQQGYVWKGCLDYPSSGPIEPLPRSSEHEHHGDVCEFPTCADCGGCTEDGGRLDAGQNVCGNCAERRHYTALDEIGWQGF